MAVKEEKYDPGYEAAYGGAYCDHALYDTYQCSLSSNGTGKVSGAISLLVNKEPVVSTAFKNGVIFVCSQEVMHSTAKGHPMGKFLMDSG